MLYFIMHDAEYTLLDHSSFHQLSPRAITRWPKFIFGMSVNMAYWSGEHKIVIYRWRLPANGFGDDYNLSVNCHYMQQHYNYWFFFLFFFIFFFFCTICLLASYDYIVIDDEKYMGCRIEETAETKTAIYFTTKIS